MQFPETISRWPAWYLALAMFVLYQGASQCFEVWRARAKWRAAIAHAETKPEKYRLKGQRVGALTYGISLLVGATLLLFDSNVARVALAMLYAWGARAKATQFATGMAEGRKAAQLAAAPEYVAGRSAPGSLEWTGGILFAAIFHGLPAALLLLSMRLK